MNYNTIISERQDRGEVITPQSLVEEMLDKLPQEVFESETATFLDPCFGTGSFLKAIGFRLKKHGHSTENINSRLFGFEVDSRMFNETKHKFSGINIVKQDFLNTDINMKFDVIVGNPPYQGKKTGGGDGSGNAIWHLFVEKCYDYLKDSGYMSLVHPSDWRTSMNKKKQINARNILFYNQMLYLELGLKPWKEQIVVDFYVLQKSKKESKSLVKFKDVESPVLFKIPDHEMIVSYGASTFNSIISKCFNTNNNGLHSRKSFGGLRILDKSAKQGNYKFAHGSKSIRKDIFKFYEFPHIHQYKSKLLMSATGPLMPMYDSGNLGIGDHIHYILVDNKEQADFMSSIINSKLGIFLQKTHCNWNWKGMSTFANVSYPFSRISLDITTLESDDDVYRYFNLNSKEIKHIEESINDEFYNPE